MRVPLRTVLSLLNASSANLLASAKLPLFEIPFLKDCSKLANVLLSFSFTINNFDNSGITQRDISYKIYTKEILQEDGEYYVYVETWASRTFSYDLNYTIRPAVKVKIDKSNPINMISAIIDGLQENTTHYFRIFTYMRAGKSYEYTELFDASVSSDYVASVYDFKTAKASDIFFNHSVSYTSSEEIYGNRILNTKMNLLAYANNIAFNFDIIYEDNNIIVTAIAIIE